MYLHFEVKVTVASFLLGELSLAFPGSFPRAFPVPLPRVLTQTFLVKINTAGVCIKLNSTLPYMDIPLIHV